MWGPVAQDGLFFTTNAEDILINGADPGIPYIIGTTSYEGSQFKSDRQFSRTTIRSELFGNNDPFGETTLPPISQESFHEAASQYLTKFHPDEFDNSDFEKLSTKDLNILAGYVYGDRSYALPSWTMAQLYAEKNATVHHYVVDVSPAYDVILNEEPDFPGCGHKMDLFYLFGKPVTLEYKITLKNIVLKKWEQSLSFELMKLYTSFAHDGKVHTKEWLPFSNEIPSSFHISNNDTSIITSIKTDPMDSLLYWDSTINPGSFTYRDPSNNGGISIKLNVIIIL